MASVWPVIVGAGTMYGIMSGKFAEWSGFDKNKRQSSENGKSFSEERHLTQSPSPPQVIVYEQPASRSQGSSYLFMGGSALLILAGYYYYIHKHGTKKVINKVEETAEQTQDLVSKSDKNNAKRFEELDARNTDRANNLEAEIRSETRAGFAMIREQLYCLTQVCIQNLSAIAHSGDAANIDENEAGGNNGNEFGRSNDKLLQYTERAQQMADTIISDETLIQKKSNHLEDIRAEIYARTQSGNVMHSGQEYVTPGGPGDTPMGPDDNDNNRNNVFDLEANQSPYLTNISYKDSDHMRDESSKKKSKNGKNVENGNYFSYLWNNEFVSNMIPFGKQYSNVKQVFDNAKENQHLVFAGMGVLLLGYSGYRAFAPSSRPQPMIYDTSNIHNDKQ